MENSKMEEVPIKCTHCNDIELQDRAIFFLLLMDWWNVLENMIQNEHRNIIGEAKVAFKAMKFFVVDDEAIGTIDILCNTLQLKFQYVLNTLRLALCNVETLQ